MDDGEHLIIITTDRVSIYDQVFPNPIPGKGVFFNRLTNFWFDFLKVQDHRVSMSEMAEKELDDFLGMEEEVQDRMMLVRKAEPFPVSVVLKAYMDGNLIPDGPILIPVKKDRNENITAPEAAVIIGAPWEVIVDMAFDIFNRAAKFTSNRGITLIDTKFEFGMVDGEVTLIDEVLTPDNSTFFIGPHESYGKQFIQDWLISTSWKYGEDLPEIPKNVVNKTIEKYRTLFSILTT